MSEIDDIDLHAFDFELIMKAICSHMFKGDYDRYYTYPMNCADRVKPILKNDKYWGFIFMRLLEILKDTKVIKFREFYGDDVISVTKEVYDRYGPNSI